MPKTKRLESVTNDWVLSVTFQMQALLMTAMRGPDGCSKDNPAKSIVRYLRGAVLKPAAETNLSENNDDFMWGDYSQFKKWSKAFWSDHDGYPHHFIMHLIHAAQVVAEYWDSPDKIHWQDFYKSACKSMHMSPETAAELEGRLNDFGEGWHNKSPKLIENET